MTSPPPYDPAHCDGANATAANPISAGGLAEPGRRYTIPARQGRAVRLGAGQSLRIVNPHGTQVCDFFALAEDTAGEGGPAEVLSMEHSRTALGRIYARQGDRLVSNRRRALIEIAEDSSPGVHDILIAACDWPRYQQLGSTAYHDNCADNFRMSLAAIGIKPVHVPCPFNIWMNVPVGADGGFTWRPPASRPGDYVVLRALAPCIAVMSACPQDMTPVNGAEAVPQELEFKVGTP